MSASPPSASRTKGIKAALRARKSRATASSTELSRVFKEYSTVRLERHSISEAREKLPLLVDRATSVAAPTIAITRRGKDQVVLLTMERFEALRTRAEKSDDAIADAIVDRLLQGAPAHITSPQRKELGALKHDQLRALEAVTGLPLKGAERTRVSKAVGVEVLSRLERRHAIAKTVAQAADEGLYEATEHLTSDLSVWDEKP